MKYGPAASKRAEIGGAFDESLHESCAYARLVKSILQLDSKNDQLIGLGEDPTSPYTTCEMVHESSDSPRQW